MHDTLDLGSWCILRASSQQTLAVADTLSRAGYRVWTPVSRKIGRTPRRRREFDKVFPLMPSYVFADVAHLDDLLRMAMVPGSDTPRFTVFRLRDGFPLIADSELEALRAEERRLTGIFNRHKLRGIKAKGYEAGDVVRVTEGCAQGMEGIVQGQHGQYTLVSFYGQRPIKIASLLLDQNVASGRQSIADTAAQAA